MTGVLEQVGGLLKHAMPLATSPDDKAALESAARRLAEPMRVAIAGRLKAGKSTLLNALVGEELAPTDASECTQLVTWYRNGVRYDVRAYLRDGEVTSVPFTRGDGAIAVDLKDLEFEGIDHLDVNWPSRRLEAMTLIDTPGVESSSTHISARSTEFFASDPDRPGEADAVVYLVRHVHPGDVRLLESFHDRSIGRNSPMAAVAVLSRADEIGGCRLDAMEVADRAAERYMALPELHRLCLDIVPVAGLAAQAATTITEAEYQAVAELSRLPPSHLANLLLTVDRFSAEDDDLPVPAEMRRRLLDRIGLYALRVETDAIRKGAVQNSRQFADDLMRRSGLPRLQTLLATHFAGRSRMLKARSALLVLNAVLGSRLNDPLVKDILREAERLEAGSHEFEEFRLLGDLRAGVVPIDEDRKADLEVILGASGDEPYERLGLEPEASTDDITAAAGEALSRWRKVAQHPLTGRELVDVAQVAIRSLEGILADVHRPAGDDRPADF